MYVPSLILSLVLIDLISLSPFFSISDDVILFQFNKFQSRNILIRHNSSLTKLFFPRLFCL
jgi:hypothetical protein